MDILYTLGKVVLYPMRYLEYYVVWKSFFPTCEDRVVGSLYAKNVYPIMKIVHIIMSIFVWILLHRWLNPQSKAYSFKLTSKMLCLWIVINLLLIFIIEFRIPKTWFVNQEEAAKLVKKICKNDK